MTHSDSSRTPLRGAVTGGTSGLGLALVEAFAARGDAVAFVARDADRVRHWLGNGDLDFVVRVYAALVTPDTSMARSSGCAVITPEQIPAWIEALPRQRSLSTGRRHHLLARVREAVVDKGARQGW